MRRLSAHYIFPAAGPALKYGIIVLDDEGLITGLVDTGGNPSEISGLEFYPGILVPGFVNAHCHLELSHLKGRIPRGTGLSGFVEKVSGLRPEIPEVIERQIRRRAAEMYQNGTSVAADIVNTGDTIAAKSGSPVHWHSFIELFGLKGSDASRIWSLGKELQAGFHKSNLAASISPHAPYSVSRELWDHFRVSGAEFISIHNQESLEEEELMSRRGGKMAEWFARKGFNQGSLPGQKPSSLKSVIDFLPDVQRILLVHNTFTGREDIAAILEKYSREQVYWVLCPRSNLYIEGQLPETLIMNREGLNVCLGTDSLASNDSLSVLDEMKCIQDNYPEIPLEELIEWGTINGARALGVEGIFGSLEPGKTPGVVWIDGIDFKNPALTDKSRAVRVV